MLGKRASRDGSAKDDEMILKMANEKPAPQMEAKETADNETTEKFGIAYCPIKASEGDGKSGTVGKVERENCDRPCKIDIGMKDQSEDEKIKESCNMSESEYESSFKSSEEEDDDDDDEQDGEDDSSEALDEDDEVSSEHEDLNEIDLEDFKRFCRENPQ